MEKSSILEAKVTSLAWHRFNRAQDIAPRLFDLATDHYGEFGVQESWDEFWCFADDQPPFCVDNLAFGCYAHYFVFHWLPDEDGEVRTSSLKRDSFAKVIMSKPDNEFSFFEREVIKAAFASPFSFYEVLDVKPKRNVKVKCIFREKEIIVDERMTNSQFRIGDILYGRLASVHDTTVFFPLMPLVFPAQLMGEILDLKKVMWGKTPARDVDLIRAEFEIRELCLDFAAPVLMS